ncbi:uncharacterized protein [Mytilus edulis]|uniref:CCHC-type domain-containing protein n=1 Tax=Mytilus edulis TaxID=6550 RepID=A0A8S3VJ01_MYTED|nr:unnamed protein product [Mytilus edulis]
MSDEEDPREVTNRDSEPPNQTDPGNHVGFSPEDALSLFSRQLDTALVRHKKELFAQIDLKIGNSPLEKSSRLPSIAPKFKFEGNGRQHEFNTARINELSRATDFLERGSVGAAVKALEQAEAALKERNKLLRIADKYGWDVVEEFMDDPLTESTEEATRLKQAEYRAKMKRRDKYTKADRPNPYYKNPVDEKATSDLFRRPSSTYSEDSSRSRSTAGGKGIYTSNEYFGGKKGATRCFYCNEEGHWAYQCPRKAGRYPPEKQQQ